MGTHINKKINSLERELFSLEQDRKPGVKTIKYEGVRLEIDRNMEERTNE